MNKLEKDLCRKCNQVYLTSNVNGYCMSCQKKVKKMIKHAVTDAHNKDINGERIYKKHENGFSIHNKRFLEKEVLQC